MTINMQAELDLGIAYVRIKGEILHDLSKIAVMSDEQKNWISLGVFRTLKHLTSSNEDVKCDAVGKEYCWKHDCIAEDCHIKPSKTIPSAADTSQNEEHY